MPRHLTAIRAIIMPLTLTWSTLLVLALPTDTLMAQLGDYTRIETLTYSSVPSVPFISSHYHAPACATNAIIVAEYIRTGQDSGPLSPQYMMNASAPRYLDYSSGPYHGFGAFVGAAIAGHAGPYGGACRADLCRTGWPFLNDAMTLDAAKHKTAEAFLRLDEMPTPDYAGCVAYLRAHPGSSVLLTTGSYDAAVLVAVQDDLTLWLTYEKPGPPLRLWKDHDEGERGFRSLVDGQAFPPNNYVAVMNPR